MRIPHGHERFDATRKCTNVLPECTRMPFFYARNARKKQSAFKHAGPLINSLASAVGDGQSRLQIPTRIHQTPFVFPFLAWLIETLFPGLIESFEPRMIKAH